jgi:hypothetical protein
MSTKRDLYPELSDPRFLKLFKRYVESALRGIAEGNLKFHLEQVGEAATVMALAHLEQDARESS